MQLVFCDLKKTTTTLIKSPLDMIETDNPNTLNQSNNTRYVKDEMQDYDHLRHYYEIIVINLSRIKQEKI